MSDSKTALSSAALDATFSALADPTRRAILARLANGEASVTELAKPFSMSLPAISKHLGVLERAGLSVRRREAQWRPRQLDFARFRQVEEWLQPYHDLWERRYSRLDEYLLRTQGPGKKYGGKPKN